MQLGRVVGRIWSTVKNPGLEAQRLLLVQPVKPLAGGTGLKDVVDSGKVLVCTDCAGAGADELVYWVKGREASFPFQGSDASFPFQGRDVPTDATVVGIVDELHSAS
jgi:microcompartment protein CcmK/EutM